MRIDKRIAGASMVFVLVVAALVGIFVYMTYLHVDTSTIEYIEQYQQGNFIFNDIAGDIQVESIDDIGYIVEGEYQIDIYYGKQRIKMNRACFKSKSYRDALKTIGIVVKTHKNDDGTILYKVTCWDEDVVELSNVN